MKRITQNDIARELGLSHATVALVVGKTNSPLQQRLSPETVRRIKEKAKEMGYQPHRGAQMLRTGRSNLIVVLNFGGYSELAARRIYHLSRLVQEADYDFLAIDAFWWQGNAQIALEQVRSLRPEGMIVIESLRPPFSAEHVQDLVKGGIPTVTISTEIQGVPLVRHDVATATWELTRNALEQGRKRLMLLVAKSITGNVPWQMRERTEGFTRALLEAGHRAPKIIEDFDYCYRSRGKRVEAIISRYTEPRKIVRGFDSRPKGAAAGLFTMPVLPDALICGNDEFALSILTQCYRRKLSVPKELFISGFDDLHYGTEGLVFLTTVAQNIERLCEEALEILKEQITKKASKLEKKPVQRVVPCEVIWRESTGAIEEPI